MVSGGAAFGVLDSSTVDLTLSGDGSGADPYTLRADATITLGELDGVNVTGATGYVLAKQADGTFALAPPATVAPGSINVGNGLTGDGTSGNPLNLVLSANSGLIVDATGLRSAVVITDTGYISTGVVTPSSGWTLNEGKARRWGPVVMLQFVLTRTGALIPGSGSGNITNVQIATLATGWRPNTGFSVGFTQGHGGHMWGGFANPSGQIVLGALPPNVGVGTGDVLYGNGMWLTDQAI